MSKTIDEKVVEMRFDNRQFENNVQTSISSLDKLKQSLQLEESAKSFEKIDTASKNINFSGLCRAVDSVKSSFSAFEVMAVTALANITNSAVNTGKQLLHSLFIEPRKQGFEEYELKMGSIQTMMMSSGESLETVNKYLDELNTYADKTIYSFSDMTSNIGKFTNAGVGLKESVKAIQGISNVAAISGANTNEASRAMYNFAQALSAGSVKLIDWKSIENANMATADFKNHLLQTALELGTVKKEGDKFVTTTTNIQGKISDTFDATSNFNDSLNHQWMTTDVLVKTLEQYSDETTEIGKKAFAAAQDVKTFSQMMDTLKESVGSGWATTWEIVFGDFEEAKTLWTNVSNVVGDYISKMSDARNNLLKGWKELGGRTAVIQAFKNAFEGLKSVITPIKQAISEMFPPLTAERLVKMSESLRDFTAKLKLSKKASTDLKNTFKGLFAALDIVKQLITAILKPIGWLADKFGGKTKGLGGSILGATGSFGEWLVKVDEYIKKNDVFIKALETAVNFLKNAWESFKKFADSLRQKLHIPDLEAIKKSLSDFIGKASEKFKTPGLSTLQKVLLAIGEVLMKIGDIFVSVKNKIVGAADNLGKSLSQNKIFNAVIKVFNGLKKIFKGILKVLGNFISAILDKLSKGDIEGIINIINGFLTGGLIVGLKKLVGSMAGPFDELSNVIGGFSKVVGGLGKVNGILDKVTGILDGVGGCLQTWQNKLKSDILVKIAIALALLAASLLAISFIDSEKLNSSIGAITVLFTNLMGSMAVFSKIGDGKNMSKASSGLIAISAAILIMSFALKKIGSLETDQMIRGVTGIFACTGIMVAASLILSKNNRSFKKSASSMIVFSVALQIFASSCKKLSKLSWDELARGLTGVAVLSALLVATAKILSKNNKSFIKGAASMILFATSLKILASACRQLAKLSWDELAKGLVGVGALLIEVAVFLQLAKFQKKAISSSLGIVLIASAIKILASSCKTFAELDNGSLAKGLIGVGALLLEIVAFTKLTQNAKKIITTSTGLIAMGAAIKIFASALKDISSLSVGELAKGLIGMGGAIMLVAAALNLMPKGSVIKGIGLIATAASLIILSKALKSFAEMSVGGIAKSIIALAGSLVVIAAALNLMKGTMGGAAALMAASLAIAVLVPVLKLLSDIKPGDIVKALLTLAGAFAVITIAAYALKPVITTVLAFGAALVLMGVGVAAIGAGLLIASIGLASLGTSITLVAAELVAGLAVIVIGLADLIPTIAKKMVEGLIEMVKVLSDNFPVITDAVKVILLSLLDVLKDCVPVLVDTLLYIMVEALKSLVEYVPKIVDLLLELLTKVLQEVAKGLPALIAAAVDVLMAFLAGLADAIMALDPRILAKALLGIGILAAIMVALGAVAALVPEAMLGVLGMGALIAELALVLAAIGLLEQIPGLNWLMNEGGKILEGIGNAIGSFIGGIVGGVMKGVTKQLPDMADNLSEFMKKLEPFISGASGINASSLSGVKTIAEIVLMLTAANILNGITSWLTGGTSIVKFGEELAEFGPSLKKYADSVKGVNESSVKASANAAKILAEMAKGLPKHGGVVQWFAGETSLADFANELIEFGPAIKKYSDSIKGLDPKAVETSANAAKALSNMANGLPKHSGLSQWISGDSSLTAFAKELESFGPAMKTYSDSIKGLKPEAVEASASAAKALGEAEKNLKEHGGIVSWFKGDSSFSTFAEELNKLGPAMKSYSMYIDGIKPEAVTASANATKALAEAEKNLKEHGGIASWFKGDSSLSSFAEELKKLGPSMRNYSMYVDGIKPEAVTASANATKALAEAEKVLKEHGGISKWFTGDSSLSSFAEQLEMLGPSMKNYSMHIEGIKPEAVEASAYAAKSLAEADNALKDHGGISSWFKGDSSLSSFAKELKNLGPAMKIYSDSIQGLKPETVEASSNAAKALAEAEGALKDHGGISKWFTGDSSFSDFAKELENLGPSIQAYSDSVKGIKTKDVTASADAVKILAEAEGTLKEHGGIKSWILGDSDLSSFAKGIEDLGESLGKYCKSISNVDSSKVEAAGNAAKVLAELSSTLPTVGGIASWFNGNKQSLEDFGNSLDGLGKGLGKLYTQTYGINLTRFRAVVAIVKDLVDYGAKLMGIKTEEYMKFGENLGKMAEYGIYKFQDAFENAQDDILNTAKNMMEGFGNKIKTTTEDYVADRIKDVADIIVAKFDDKQSKFQKAGADLFDSFVKGVSDDKSEACSTVVIIIDAMYQKISGKYNSFMSAGSMIFSYFITGINQNKQSVSNIFTHVTDDSLREIKKKRNDFYNSGAYLIEGFSDGIRAYIALAQIAASDVALAAKTALEKALSIHSPSKVAYGIGAYFGIGFVNAINDYRNDSYYAAESMADSAKDGLGKALSRINDIIENGIDTEPTIRPVLDLSNVSSGMNTLNSMFVPQHSLNLASGNSLRINTALANSGEIKINNDNIISELNKLRGDIASLGNIVGNMKVIMDTGALVGSIAAPMNRALGKQYVYERRGI